MSGSWSPPSVSETAAFAQRGDRKTRGAPTGVGLKPQDSSDQGKYPRCQPK